VAPNLTRESSVETVQDAVRLTIHESRTSTGQHLPPKAIAEGMNLSAGILYDIADETRERKLRAEELPSLILTTRNFLILDVIERAVGRMGVMLPQGDLVTLAESAAVILEFGQFLEKLATGAPNGYTREEARQVRAEGEQAMSKIASLIKAVEAQAGIGRARGHR
jgi:hypothetical protein